MDLRMLDDRAAGWARPQIAVGIVTALVAAFWAPLLWRSNLLNWHIQTAYSAAQLCDWPLWQEGFTTLCTDDWYYRVLERRTLKVPSALWTSLAAHRWGSAPVFYALPWLLHAATAALVTSIALRCTGRALLSVFVGLLFGLHPASAEVMVTGQFTQYVFAALFSTLALRAALGRGSRSFVALALLMALLSDVTCVVMPLVVLAWVEDRRRWWAPCLAVFVLGGLLHSGHAWLYPGILTHHLEYPTMPLGERLFRACVVEPVLALRRLMLLWSPESGPWYLDSPVAEFSGLGPFRALPMLGLAGLLSALVWAAKRCSCGLALRGLLPVALLLLDVSLRAGISDVVASRWSGLRHVYMPVLVIALAIAWGLRHTTPRRWLRLGGALVLLWACALSWSLAERTWTRMADDRQALRSAVQRLESLALAPGSTVYLFGVADPRPFSIWQATLRDQLGDLRFFIVTRGPGTVPGYRPSSAREIEVELDPDEARFLRPEAQPSWAGPIDLSESLTLYMRRGGQLNAWPIFDSGVLRGPWVSLPGSDGAAVRVKSQEPDGALRLQLRTLHDLEDPRTVLLVERRSGWEFLEAR